MKQQKLTLRLHHIPQLTCLYDAETNRAIPAHIINIDEIDCTQTKETCLIVSIPLYYVDIEKVTQNSEGKETQQ